MIYTPKTKLALNLVYKAHAGQIDKSGIPYIFHPYHVAEQMDDEKTTICALLHDVVEDTDITFKDLLSYGFDEDIIETLRLLTHDKSIPYMDYIKNIKPNPIARKVKIADLQHNSDISRLSSVSEKDLQRIEKYKQALSYLSEGL